MWLERTWFTFFLDEVVKTQWYSDNLDDDFDDDSRFGHVCTCSQSHLERVPELGQITWWIVCWQKKGDKFVRKSRNSFSLNSGGMGGKLIWKSNGLSPETNTKAQKMLFVSRPLCLPWYSLVLNFWSFLLSFYSKSLYPPWCAFSLKGQSSKVSFATNVYLTSR